MGEWHRLPPSCPARRTSSGGSIPVVGRSGDPTTDREAELEALAAALREREEVEDAWLAKSFTDRLPVVDLRAATLPEDLRALLADRDFYGANEVYGLDDGRSSFMGGTGGADRRRFVDLRTRGEHRSYVVD